jgi:hypothetical protein
MDFLVFVNGIDDAIEIENRFDHMGAGNTAQSKPAHTREHHASAAEKRQSPGSGRFGQSARLALPKGDSASQTGFDRRRKSSTAGH